MTAATPDLVPIGVVSAAQEAELGRHRASFVDDPVRRAANARARTLTPTVRWSVTGALVFVAVAFLAAAPGAVHPGMPLLGAGLFVLLALMIAASPAVHQGAAALHAKISRRPPVWIFEHGLVSRDTKTNLITVYPWARSRIVRANTRHNSGSAQFTTYDYRVTRDDRTTLVLTGVSTYESEVRVLGEMIVQEISKVRLPRALDALQRQQKLDFGPLGISLRGISDGRDTTPWAQVEAIEVREGVIRIRRDGALTTWAKISVGSVPDVDVLLTLAEALHTNTRTAD